MNADAIISGNQYTYCKNSPIIHADDNGFALAYCLDDQGLETSFLHYCMTGGGGGGSSGYVGTVYARSKPEDISVLCATAKTLTAVISNASFEVGAGTGMAGELDLIIANSGGGIRFDAINFTVSREGTFFGQKTEFAASLCAGIMGIEGLSLGGSVSATWAHAYSGCESDHELSDYIDCPHSESNLKAETKMSFGFSVYLLIGATVNLGVDIKSLWNDLQDIWIQ